jgi:putative acetyltransferase
LNAAPVTIRPEGAEDISVIHALTRRAFAQMPYADGDEQDLIDALRLAKALSLSLVAECGGEVVGHIAFSPMTPKGWFALGPVSVEPALQRQGIGSALIRVGLGYVREAGAVGCALTGNPLYYQRFGFALDPAACPADQPPKYSMTHCFGSLRPSGPMAFHRLFNGLP